MSSSNLPIKFHDKRIVRCVATTSQKVFSFSFQTVHLCSQSNSTSTTGYQRLLTLKSPLFNGRLLLSSVGVNKDHLIIRVLAWVIKGIIGAHSVIYCFWSFL
jgi:hypothetical protein